MANSTVCQSKWKPIVEPRQAKPKTYPQAPTNWTNLIDLDPSMLYTKTQPQSSFGSGELINDTKEPNLKPPMHEHTKKLQPSHDKNMTLKFWPP